MYCPIVNKKGTLVNVVFQCVVINCPFECVIAQSLYCRPAVWCSCPSMCSRSWRRGQRPRPASRRRSTPSLLVNSTPSLRKPRRRSLYRRGMSIVETCCTHCNIDLVERSVGFIMVVCPSVGKLKRVQQNI